MLHHSNALTSERHSHCPDLKEEASSLSLSPKGHCIGLHHRPPHDDGPLSEPASIAMGVADLSGLIAQRVRVGGGGRCGELPSGPPPPRPDDPSGCPSS